MKVNQNLIKRMKKSLALGGIVLVTACPFTTACSLQPQSENLIAGVSHQINLGEKPIAEEYQKELEILENLKRRNQTILTFDFEVCDHQEQVILPKQKVTLVAPRIDSFPLYTWPEWQQYFDHYNQIYKNKVFNIDNINIEKKHYIFNIKELQQLDNQLKKLKFPEQDYQRKVEIPIGLYYGDPPYDCGLTKKENIYSSECFSFKQYNDAYLVHFIRHEKLNERNLVIRSQHWANGATNIVDFPFNPIVDDKEQIEASIRYMIPEFGEEEYLKSLQQNDPITYNFNENDALQRIRIKDRIAAKSTKDSLKLFCANIQCVNMESFSLFYVRYYYFSKEPLTENQIESIAFDIFHTTCDSEPSIELMDYQEFSTFDQWHYTGEQPSNVPQISANTINCQEIQNNPGIYKVYHMEKH